jgi:hypothetical protein
MSAGFTRQTEFTFWTMGVGASLAPILGYEHGWRSGLITILLIAGGGFVGLIAGGMFHSSFFAEDDPTSRAEKVLMNVARIGCFLGLLLFIGITTHD